MSTNVHRTVDVHLCYALCCALCCACATSTVVIDACFITPDYRPVKFRDQAPTTDAAAAPEAAAKTM